MWCERTNSVTQKIVTSMCHQHLIRTWPLLLKSKIVLELPVFAYIRTLRMKAITKEGIKSETFEHTQNMHHLKIKNTIAEENISINHILISIYHQMWSISYTTNIYSNILLYMTIVISLSLWKIYVLPLVLHYNTIEYKYLYSK